MANRIYNKQVSPKGYKKGGSVRDTRKTEQMIGASISSKREKGRIKKKMGGPLKPVDPKTQKGLSKLPTKVRNKMGYMKDGGKVKKKKRFKSTKEIEDYGKQAVASIEGIGDSIRDRNTPMKFQRLKDRFKIKN